MNRAILVLALVTSAFLTVHVNGQTAASRMTMSTIQAMVSGGVPLPTIVQTIRTAKKIDFYINDRERSRLMEAGATAGDVAQIFDAIHYREYMNVDAHIVVPPAPAPAMTVPVHGCCRTRRACRGCRARRVRSSCGAHGTRRARGTRNNRGTLRTQA